MDTLKFMEDTILNQAYRLRRHAIAVSSTTALNPNDACWLITKRAWDNLRREISDLNYVAFSEGRKELMGLEIRISIDDSPETPDIELLMRPKLKVM